MFSSVTTTHKYIKENVMGNLNTKEIKQESKFERPPALPAGSYPARIVQVIDLGLQAQRDYNGQAKPPINSLSITYELVDEFLLDEDGNDMEDKPRWMSETFGLFALTSDMATSTKRMVALDTDGEADGDWTKMVGKPCTINVVENPSSKPGDDTIYNNVKGATAMRPKDVAKLPELVNKPKLFEMSDDPDLDIFLSLSNYLQDLVKKGLEFEGSALDIALQNRGKVVPIKEELTTTDGVVRDDQLVDDQEGW
jgi:hypothetical protein